MDTIEGMRTFVAVASRQSFTAAAKQLGVSTNIASKYVQRLEERLGAQLFHRTTRSVTLTETGRAYLERCIPLLDQFDELEGVVLAKQSELAGSIRMTASTGFGSMELVEALAPFQQTHPNVQIQLHLSDHKVRLIEEGYDLAIRFGTLADSTMLARKLMDMRIVVYASSKYLSQNGTPRNPKELSSHNCLISRTSPDPDNWRFKIKGKETTIPVQGTFHANSPRAIAHMALRGAGIGMGPLYSITPFLKRKRLTLLFENDEAKALGLYAVYPSSRHLASRVRALIDHLAETFAENPYS